MTRVRRCQPEAAGRWAAAGYWDWLIVSSACDPQAELALAEDFDQIRSAMEKVPPYSAIFTKVRQCDQQQLGGRTSCIEGLQMYELE